MKRMLLAAFVLASTLGVGHAQTQTYHFGEGQTQMPGERRTPPRRPHGTRARRLIIDVPFTSAAIRAA